MFEMHTDRDIAQHRASLKQRLIDSYSPQSEGTDKIAQIKDLLSKAIDSKTFGEKYPTAQYEYFTPAAVEKFKEDFSKGSDNSEGLVDSFAKAIEGLEPVAVTEDKSLAIIYVRKKKETASIEG